MEHPHQIYDKAQTFKEKIIHFGPHKEETHLVLDDISLDIKKGETVRILWKSKVSRVAKIEYAGKYGFIRLKNLA